MELIFRTLLFDRLNLIITIIWVHQQSILLVSRCKHGLQSKAHLDHTSQ